jgi:F-type H+-transporting ATPase subunit delta
MARLISEIYGNAMYELAVEEPSRMDDFEAEANALKDILKANPDFITVMTHPEISGEEKSALIDSTFSGSVSDEILELMHILSDKHHFGKIMDVLNDFTARVREFKREGNAIVTSAVELNDGQKQKIEKRLIETTDYDTIDIDYRIDPALLGGLIIRIGDRVVDSSVRTAISDLRRDLLLLQLR